MWLGNVLEKTVGQLLCLLKWTKMYSYLKFSVCIVKYAETKSDSQR